MYSLHIAIPAYNEWDHLPETLNDLVQQSDHHFELWVCVNDPENTPHTHPKIHQNNQDTLDFLKHKKTRLPFQLHVLDGTGKGKGVGWARQYLAQTIYQYDSEGITACLDADCMIGPEYIHAIRQGFLNYPDAVGMAIPYWHPLPENEEEARLMLRYEVYMRWYQIQLWEIGSPYAYLSLGSAMAYRNKAWKAVRGIPQRQAGEDFYFLQKLRKTGDLIRWIPSTVLPASRYSDRVPFGTGQLIQPGNWSVLENRFPLFSPEVFRPLQQTFQQFQHLSKGPCPLSIDSFLAERNIGETPFNRIRSNSRTVQQFIRNAHQFLDGLKTLQIVRYFFNLMDKPVAHLELDCFHSPLQLLEDLRKDLFEKEKTFQMNYMANWPEGDTMTGRVKSNRAPK